MFTIVKPVKKPKKSFDGGFSSPNFDDNGNNGNSFVKSSFVKNSFNDFGGNSNGGFESSKNSGFKSSTVNNQFFTTKSTFSGRISLFLTDLIIKILKKINLDPWD